MTDSTFAESSADTPTIPAPHDPVPVAFIESRERWRHLANLAADMAFETDAHGCFVLLSPALVLGWPADTLIGKPATLLTGGDTTMVVNPFCSPTAIRRHRACVRRFGGQPAVMHVSATPLYDATAKIVGYRGIGIDITDHDAATSRMANHLRRTEMLDHILTRVGQDTDTDAMMDSALAALVQALGAEGAAVLGSPSDVGAIAILQEHGSGASVILPASADLLRRRSGQPSHTASSDGRQILVARCQTRFGPNTGLAIWRGPRDRIWDTEDTLLAGSAVGMIRMILDYAAFVREMAHQARTDPLTGLLNRRAFLDEIRRTIARLDRESDSGTLMFIDLDAFKAINDQFGHAMGDEALVHFAGLLKQLVRPSDSIARLGGDEFAIWLSSADHMTAAERADFLCKNIPGQMQALMPGMPASVGLSIGIATRAVGSRETIEDLIKRADEAMYEVKRSGRNHWRVSQVDAH